MEYVEYYNKRYDKAITQEERKRLSRKSGCKGEYIMRRMPRHNRITDTPVDPMHLFKNIREHLVQLISGVKDTIEVCEEEKARNQFESCWVEMSGDLPHSPFSLTKIELKCANNRAKSICIPSNFDWKPRDLFTSSSTMKSHEWREILCSGVLKFCLRDLLGAQQQASLFLM